MGLWVTVCAKTERVNWKRQAVVKLMAFRCEVIFSLITAGLLSVSSTYGQNQTPDWQAQVRKYAEAGDWQSAMRLVDQETARAPENMDVRAWRARVLTWSGHLAEAETEYLKLLKVSRNDPDNWMGLAAVYLRQGRVQEAGRAIDAAEALDPKRADLHAARARVLRAAGERNEARSEFQKALNLDPTSGEARAGLASLRGEPKNKLRLGQDNDLLSFASDYRDEWTSLVSQWTPGWATSVSGDLYQRGGVDAGKFVASITRRQPKWGAVTVGGAIGHDNAVIPKSEAFFDLDYGRRTKETSFVRSVELNYEQHWYWYAAARILTLSGTATAYLPQDWTISLRATAARSAFSGTNAEWRPSAISRLEFPLARWDAQRLSGNVVFALGEENFAQVDQIGRFASHTYGAGLRLQVTARQDVTGYASYQKRAQNRIDTSFGLSYGIEF